MTIIVIPSWVDIVVLAFALAIICTALWIIWQDWKHERERRRVVPLEHHHVRLVQAPRDWEEEGWIDERS
jgi:hypothetical protein